MDGTFAIGMASRELKDDEAAQLTGTAIALDGIAVVVNPANTIDDLSMDRSRVSMSGTSPTGATSHKRIHRLIKQGEAIRPVPV